MISMYRLYLTDANICHRHCLNQCSRPNCCIHHLIPEQRDVNVLSRLRNPSKYPVPFARTERYKKSFLPYALRSFVADSSDYVLCMSCLILLYVFISGMLCNAVIRNKRIHSSGSLPGSGWDCLHRTISPASAL